MSSDDENDPSDGVDDTNDRPEPADGPPEEELDDLDPASGGQDAVETDGAGAEDRPSTDASGSSESETTAIVHVEDDALDTVDEEVEEATDQQSVREEILADVKEYFEEHDLDEHFASAPSEQFIEEEFFDFSYLEGHREIERKWVNKPFAYISVLEVIGENRRRYHVSEPILDDFEDYVHDYLIRILRNNLMYQDLEEGESREDIFVEKAKEIIASHATATVEDGSLRKILYYLIRDFVDYGPIDPLMRDEQIEDISCDGVEIPVYVYHFEYRDLATNIEFSRQKLNSFRLRLAQQAGKAISVSEPLVDGSLPDGSRIQLTFGGDISTRGPNFTIRRFSEIPYTPIHLIKWNTFSVEQMAYFWLAIENNRSLIFSGGTGSGKTTSMNAVSFFIPEGSKIVSIEDTREITLPHENWVQSLTRDAIGSQGSGEVSMFELLKSALRQRPEYILVGEIRTQPNVAFTFFQAIGTGHTAYTTIHADSVNGVVNRLQNEPLNIPMQMIQDLDIISIQKQTQIDGQRVRRNQQVTEILPPDQDEEFLRVSDVFRRDADADTHRRANQSEVLNEIAADHGWSRTELNQELRNREKVIRHLVDKDITGYHEVTATIRMYNRNREYLLQKIENENLDASDLKLDKPIDISADQ